MRDAKKRLLADVHQIQVPDQNQHKEPAPRLDDVRNVLAAGKAFPKIDSAPRHHRAAPETSRSPKQHPAPVLALRVERGALQFCSCT